MELLPTIVFSYIFSVLLLGILILIPQVRDKIRWKIVSASLAIPVVLGSLFYFTYAQIVTTDTEYFGGYVKIAEYHEDWNERVSCRHEIACTHTKYCTKTCRDSKGRSYSCGTEACGTLHSNDGYYHSYDVDYHTAFWQVKDSNGTTFDVGQNTFEKLAIRWNSRVFKDLNRCWGRIGCVHDNDGDMYIATFDNLNEHIETTSVTNSYTNNIPASNSLLRYRDISPEEALREGVYSYPDIHNYYQNNIIAPKGLNVDSPENEYYIQLLNARLGRKKQVRCFLLVYLNKSAMVSEVQERYWQGGNKNEIIVTVGVDNELNVQWARAFAWAFTTKEYGNKLEPAEIKNFIAEQKKLDIPALGAWLYDRIEKDYVRRPFTPINKNTDIAYPFWLCFICIILSNGITITLILFPLAPQIMEWYDARRRNTTLNLNFLKWRNK